MKINELKEEIRRRQIELQEKEKALPAHSITPYQMRAIMELEESIKNMEKKLELLEQHGEKA